MKMNFSFANRLMNDFFLLACYANGGMPETAEEIADAEQWARDTFLAITSIWEEEMGEEWEIEMDEEEEEEEECGGTCPCCYDDEDNLWSEEEWEKDCPCCHEDCDCGECEDHDRCTGAEEPMEITNPNYAEIDKEIAKVFESFGLEAPEAEDMEDIHRLMDTMSSILSEVVNKCSES